MLFRKQFLPHTVNDICCFLLISIFLPVTFVFELVVVTPDLHEAESYFHIFYWIAGCFLVFNILGNMFACMFIDTSIRTVLLRPPTEPSQRRLWHFCAVCETIVPPRSWHCDICKSCILKRDHHCLFTGCCIGHHNHRYFLLLMFYIAVGATFVTIYNSYYFWWLHADIYLNKNSLIGMIMPMFLLFIKVSWENLYLLIYMLNLIACLYSIVLLCFHLPIILHGGVLYERFTFKYDLGWRKNLEMIFGNRMHLVWLAPFIKSELPNNGVHWEYVLKQMHKNR